MTGIDTGALRRALHTAPDDAASPDLPLLDVALIMRRGRRVRNRRRLGFVAGGVCAAAVLASTVTAIVNLTAFAPPAPGHPVGPAQHGSVYPGPNHPGSSPSPQHRASGGRPTSTPTLTPTRSTPTRSTALPPGATPSPTISATATATATPSPTGKVTGTPS
jgi:hypothetical protein